MLFFCEDYIDELLENLRFNVKLNLEPAITLVENRGGNTPSRLPLPRASGRGETAHDCHGRDAVAGGDVDRGASTAGHCDGDLDAFDTSTPAFTGRGSLRVGDPAVKCDRGGDTGVRGLRSTKRPSLSLSPLCRVDVCKLDWTTFTRREGVKDASRHGYAGDGLGDDGDWWEDEGYVSAPGEICVVVVVVGMASARAKSVLLFFTFVRNAHFRTYSQA